jgi:thioesterase domain-containing protein
MGEPHELTRELERVLHHEIPLSRQIGLMVGDYNGKRLALHAPLAPNINHKATAFAGSLTAVATLAGWGMVWLILRERGLRGVIVIHQSATEYRLPISGDFVATCQAPAERAIERFLSGLQRHGKARLPLSVEIRTESDDVAVAFSGSYVAFKGETDADAIGYPMMSG